MHLILIQLEVESCLLLGNKSGVGEFMWKWLSAKYNLPHQQICEQKVHPYGPIDLVIIRYSWSNATLSIAWMMGPMDYRWEPLLCDRKKEEYAMA